MVNLQYRIFTSTSTSTFRVRMGQHRNYVSKKMLHKATGEHFNRKGHKIADMSMTILEKVHSQDAMVLSIREEHWIRQGNTKYRGINRNRSWQLTKSCYLQFFLKNSFELYFQEDQPGYSWIFVIVYMYLTLIWVLQIPTSMCLDIEGLGSLSDDEISLNISKYITTLNSRLESTVGVSDANSTLWLQLSATCHYLTWTNPWYHDTTLLEIHFNFK